MISLYWNMEIEAQKGQGVPAVPVVPVFWLPSFIFIFSRFLWFYVNFLAFFLKNFSIVVHSLFIGTVGTPLQREVHYNKEERGGVFSS